MQYVIFILLGLITWVALLAARKWSLRKHHFAQRNAFAQGAPIVHLVSQSTDAPTHHWGAWIIGSLLALGVSYGLSAVLESLQVAEFGFETAIGLTLLGGAIVATLHGLKRLPLPSPTYTLPEA